MISLATTLVEPPPVETPLVKLKLYVTLGLVVLALLEFWTAMYVYGRKSDKKHAKLMLRLHRIGGYIFLAWWIWPMWVGLTLLRNQFETVTGYQFDGPRFYHALLAVAVFILLLLKVGFVRLWQQFRMQARLLGFIVTVGTLTIWTVAGLFWLFMIGSPVLPD